MVAPGWRPILLPRRTHWAALATLCAATAAGQEPAAAPPPPSLLLITLDTTRADALGAYGGPAWATPNLDRLAADGVRFSSARAPAPITLPAHASLMTGTYPFEHGVRDNGTFILGAGALTLAERLKAAGYVTAAVPAAFVVDSCFGLDQGFDRYVDLEQKETVFGAPEPERKAQEVVDLALGLLASFPGDRPFFLWLHFFDPHFPYAPPADLQAAHPLEPPAAPAGRNPQAGRRPQQNHLYALEVAAIDRELPRLFAALERFGGAGSVVTAVVGDHGEGLGAHGEATHSVLVHDATLRVPLLLQHRTLPKGAVVAAPVSTVDLPSTLLALLGLPHDDMTGADLAPLWRGAPLETTRPLYAETCSNWFTYGWAPLYTVIDGRWKTVVGPDVRLFDLESDPDEKQDLAAAHPAVVEAAHEQLRACAEKTMAAARHAPDADEQQALHALGYLTGGQATGRDGRVLPGWIPEKALTPEEGLQNQRRYTRASQLWSQGKQPEALELLLALVRDEPDNAHYTALGANLLAASGRAEEALALIRRADELAPTTATRATLVSCLTTLGRLDEAITAAAETVTAFPKHGPARLTLARLLIDGGKQEAAREQLEILLAQPTADADTKRRAQALRQKLAK